MFLFWSFWNYCFQFVSCAYSLTKMMLCFRCLRTIDKISRRRSWSLERIKEIAASYYPDFDTRAYPKGHFDETCMDAVPLSFHIITLSSSFEDAIRLAISHGGDSDTIGTIIGSIAEARFGFPQEMEDKTISYLLDNMKDVLKIIACAWVCFLRENVSKYHYLAWYSCKRLIHCTIQEWYFFVYFTRSIIKVS